MTKMKSCLLVENDPEDQQFFMDVLHRVSSDTGCYAVACAEDAFEALRKDDFMPDYIFTELNLPDADGYDFLRAIRRSGKFKSIPIVVYTSDYSETQIEKARKAGASAMFSKTRMPALSSFLKRILQNETVL